ncbi:uncharacterized protein K02A2.6-like [Halichondria panicea]|uniref:uncharacterized protein K02A2.6-like n=1 Tax=Halichondria panicea TaxID=6063 RepID=UPI00312B361A
MATTLMGHIEAFEPEADDWPQYAERMEEMFVANEMVGEGMAEKRRSVFLSVVGKRTYNILRSLLSPDKPSTKTFEELTAVLTSHFSPPPSEVIQRFRFYGRSRQPGESVSAFIAELRKLTEYCNFGASLNAALRDRIVGGINNEATQKRLLGERALTYQRAVEISQSVETSDANLREMKPVPIKTEPVFQIGRERQETQTANKLTQCSRCGTEGHLPTTCRFKDKYCNFCKKKGHIARVCRNRLQQAEAWRPKHSRKNVRYLEEETTSESEDAEDYIKMVADISQVKRRERSPPIRVTMSVSGVDLDFEVDTGASVSLMGEADYSKLFPKHPLVQSEVRLQTYLGEPISVVGSVVVKVEYGGQTADLPLIVVKGNGPTLLGRNWLKAIRLDWQSIYYTEPAGLPKVLEKYSEIFEDGQGTFKGYEAHLEINPNAQPRYNKARTIPYSKRKGVEDELDRLVAEGTLEPVEYSDWAAPIVAVLKADKKTIRICGDFRTTVNSVSKLNRYPIPRVEDLFAGLVKGKTFSTIDLKQAYLQMKLDAQSRKYVVINTHRGLFRYTRLPYGVSSAPGLFQRAMEQMLRGIPGVVVYMDDILITGQTNVEHLNSLEEVLRRLTEAGLRAKKTKCHFMEPQVVFLGHVVDEKGLHPMPSKMKAIQEAPKPKNVTELKSYLGLLTYYGKFMGNLSTTLAPLYTLLKKSTTWNWSTDQEEAFQKSKQLLTSSNLLVRFDPTLPIVLACDASQYGIGAVLAHTMPDGSERPVGYVSRTLNDAEKNYAQLEKEGLALVFGVKKFYSYLFGHPFTLITDHKPLLGLLSECKSTSPQASARVKRWSLYLSMFEYMLTFRNTTAHANADALSRLPRAKQPKKHLKPTELVLLATHLENSPVSAEQIAEATRKDPVLSMISQYVNQGWPRATIPGQPQLRAYFDKKNELSTFEGCLLWGSRVIVPKPCQEAVLTQLHEGHQGIVRTKVLARYDPSFV